MTEPAPTRDPTTAASLLHRIDVALADVARLVPLDDARFLATHTLFEGLSDQRRQIIAWLCRHAGRVPAGADRYRVLSIGCGSGAVDLPLARALATRRPALHYVGLDPNAVHCEELSGRFAAAAVPGLELEVAATTFDDFRAPHRFDLVHGVHSFYYMPDPAAALRRARDLLAPGGELVFFHAPRAELNELATRFYDKHYGRRTWFAEDFAAMLTEADVRFARERIAASVDVSALGGDEREEHVALRDFIVQFDSRRMPAQLVAAVDDYLAAVAVERDGRRWIAHPVDAFVISAP